MTHHVSREAFLATAVLNFHEESPFTCLAPLPKWSVFFSVDEGFHQALRLALGHSSNVETDKKILLNAIESEWVEYLMKVFCCIKHEDETESVPNVVLLLWEIVLELVAPADDGCDAGKEYVDAVQLIHSVKLARPAEPVLMTADRLEVVERGLRTVLRPFLVEVFSLVKDGVHKNGTESQELAKQIRRLSNSSSRRKKPRTEEEHKEVNLCPKIDHRIVQLITAVNEAVSGLTTQDPDSWKYGRQQCTCAIASVLYGYDKEGVVQRVNGVVDHVRGTLFIPK